MSRFIEKQGFKLCYATPQRWVDCVLDDFATFLADHADCERKASASAMAMVVRFPERKALIEPMICLAKEELAHFHAVYQLMSKRGIPVKRNERDAYIKQLQSSIRHPEEEHFLDRLLVSGVIEARAHERLQLLAENLTDPDLQEFYHRLAKEEAGHCMIFYRIARHYFSPDEVDARLHSILQHEASILAELSMRPLIH